MLYPLSYGRLHRNVFDVFFALAKLAGIDENCANILACSFTIRALLSLGLWRLRPNEFVYVGGWPFFVHEFVSTVKKASE